MLSIEVGPHAWLTVLLAERGRFELTAGCFAMPIKLLLTPPTGASARPLRPLEYLSGFWYGKATPSFTGDRCQNDFYPFAGELA